MDFHQLYPKAECFHDNFETFCLKIDSVFADRINDQSCEHLFQNMKQMDNISETYDVHADLEDVNSDIEIKSKLIEQLELSHKRMELMKQHYEDKLMLLSSKILSTQRERDDVLANIGSTAENQKDDKINKVRDEYERKIGAMRNEMKKLQQAQKVHARQQLEIISQDTKLRNLRSQLDELKIIKAKLIKNIAEQSNRHKLEENRKKREIAQLQKEHRKQENAVRSLKAKMEAKDQILKRKTEEVSSLRRSQRSIQSSFRMKKLDKENKELFNAHNALKSWNNLSRALDKAARNRHMLLQFEQELERLIDERNSLTQTLSNIRQNKELENEVDSVQSNLNYIQESIKTIQQTIMELDDTKDVENCNFNNIQIIITNIKNIEEAKYLLQRLAKYAIKLSCSTVIIENKLSEHVTLLQDAQQENCIQQQLLQHFLAQSSSEKITDLFESITASVSKLSINNLSDSQRSLKSNETYDIPLNDNTLMTNDDIASTPVLNELTTKIRSRAALPHNMLFGEKK